MTVRTRLARATRRLSTQGAWLIGAGPRSAFLHYWTLRDGVDSLVCAHNFFSLLDPGSQGPCRLTLRVFDADGSVLRHWSEDLRPRGAVQLSVRELLGGAQDDHREGSLEVDLAPPADFLRARQAATAEPSNSYFVMLYRSPEGMLASAHAIDRSSVYQGVPAPLGHLLGVRKAGSVAWQCKRAITARDLREVRAVAINHAARAAEIHLALGTDDGRVVAETRRTVPARGLMALDHRPTDATTAYYVLGSDHLPTPNGKPYLWVGYGKAPMTMHHA